MDFFSLLYMCASELKKRSLSKAWLTPQSGCEKHKSFESVFTCRKCNWQENQTKWARDTIEIYDWRNIVTCIYRQQSLHAKVKAKDFPKKKRKNKQPKPNQRRRKRIRDQSKEETEREREWDKWWKKFYANRSNTYWMRVFVCVLPYLYNGLTSTLSPPLFHSAYLLAPSSFPSTYLPLHLNFSLYHPLHIAVATSLHTMPYISICMALMLFYCTSIEHNVYI